MTQEDFVSPAGIRDIPLLLSLTISSLSLSSEKGSLMTCLIPMFVKCQRATHPPLCNFASTAADTMTGWAERMGQFRMGKYFALFCFLSSFQRSDVQQPARRLHSLFGDA